MRHHPILSSLALALVTLAAAAPAAAQQWKVYEEERVALEYRNAADTTSLFAISCGSKSSDITIPLAPVIKPPAQPPMLRVTEPSGTRAIEMQWDVCGGELTCTDRPNGDVSTYFVKAKGKQLALRFADQATSVAIEAPGISLSAKADKKVFARFAALCRKQ
jgi:hypothetical protein